MEPPGSGGRTTSFLTQISNAVNAGNYKKWNMQNLSEFPVFNLRLANELADANLLTMAQFGPPLSIEAIMRKDQAITRTTAQTALDAVVADAVACEQLHADNRAVFSSSPKELTSTRGLPSPPGSLRPLMDARALPNAETVTPSTS